MVALEKLRERGVHEDHFSWPLQRNMLSRVMMWAATDCGVKAVEDHGLDGPIKRWSEIRQQLRAEILKEGFNSELNSFHSVLWGH